MRRSAGLSLYWHTVRHLRQAQIWGRLWVRLRAGRPRALEALVRARAAGTWPEGWRKPVITGPDRFQMLGETHAITAPEDWNDRKLSALWRYNLHYFDDLTALGADERRDWHQALISRWLAEVKPGRGLGWNPYPTSLRIVNWVKFALGGGALDTAAETSLASQADWLSRRVEHHLQGNHLIANAKGLLFAGCFFEGGTAEQWRDLGARLMARELRRQILADGGHEERAPMYQALILEDLLDLIQLDQVLPGQLPEGLTGQIRETAERMLSWLLAMTHPDGQIAFFNDGAFDIAPETGWLAARAEALGLVPAGGGPEMGRSGYLRLVAGPATLIADTAPLGPNHQPGHGHADTLSFELSIGTTRVCLNGGTSTYALGETRLIERGTAAHNTVEVDGQDSSEIWASFRVARRARVTGRVLDRIGDAQVLIATHDGYAQRGGPAHRRSWRLSPGRLVVEDRLEGSFQTATARLRLPPETQLLESAGVARAEIGPVTLKISTTGGRLSVESGSWAPRFGERLACPVLCLSFDGPEAAMTLEWHPETP